MALNSENVAAVQDWMVAYLADLLDVDPSQVDVTRSFEAFGLDSTATVAFTSDLGRWLGVKLDSRIMLQYDDIKSLADHIRQAHAGMARA